MKDCNVIKGQFSHIDREPVWFTPTVFHRRQEGHGRSFRLPATGYQLSHQQLVAAMKDHA